MQLTITTWVQGTGVQFVSLLNAAQLASCCGAALLLPSRFIFGESSRKYQFPLLKKRHSFCVNVTGSSDTFFYRRIPDLCRTHEHRSRAYHAANRYAQVPIACRNGSTGTVAHLRTLDMDPTHAVHSEYAQPPLSFYLSAWKDTGDDALHVVHRDLSSPTAKVLALLGHTTSVGVEMQSHASFSEDLRILLCARNLIMSHSSLVFIALMNPLLERVYYYQRPAVGPWRPLAHTCTTAHLHTNATLSRPWRASDRQRLLMVTADAPTAFVRARAACLLPPVFPIAEA